MKEGAQRLRWLHYTEINEEVFSLIIDRRVGDMLENDFRNTEFLQKVFYS